MNYLVLFWEFFKTGLFSIGGGLATLPFLYRMAGRFDWFTEADLLDMVAISESTPGPFGINMATYAGFANGGVLGALVATAGLVAPSIIIIVLIAKFLSKFSERWYVRDAFYGLRPVVTGLIAAAGFQVMRACLFTPELWRQTGNLLDFFDLKAVALFAVLFVLTNKIKAHPIFYLAGAAVVGVVLKF